MYVILDLVRIKHISRRYISMKLKPLVVASMSVLGLLAYPAFADTDTTPKHKTHHTKMRHHHMVAQQEMATVPQQAVQPVVDVPRIDTYQVVYDTMGQNLGRFTHGCPDWFNRIAFSGGINFDYHLFNRDARYMGENYRRFSVNDAYLNTTANVNECTKAFISLSYNNASSDNIFIGPFFNFAGPQYSSAYPPGLHVEQAYMSFNNFGWDCFPVFFQFGKQFTDFGRYTIHPMIRTLTQVMTESLQTSAKVGFIMPMGLNGEAYVFENPLREFGHRHTNFIYGGEISYTQPCECLGYDVGIGWMSNMLGVNDIAHVVGNFSRTFFFSEPVYHHNVAGWAAHADINSGPFFAGLRYVRSVQNFAPADLPASFAVDFTRGAHPWAFDINAGYNFSITTCCGCQPQTVWVGYQRSGDARFLFLPRDRWVAGYTLDPSKNTTLGLEYALDRGYGSFRSTNRSNNGTRSSILQARAEVRFG